MKDLLTRSTKSYKNPADNPVRRLAHRAWRERNVVPYRRALESQLMHEIDAMEHTNTTRSLMRLFDEIIKAHRERERAAQAVIRSRPKSRGGIDSATGKRRELVETV